MKKISHLIFATLFSAVLFFSCGSTEEIITSTIKTDHMTVHQINSGIRLVVTKDAAEDINLVEITDKENKCTATVDLSTETSTSFLWPFVDGKREYTLTGKFSGNSDSFEESVSFTVENKCVSLTPISENLKNSSLKLIADGNKRLVKTLAPANELTALAKNPAITKSGIKIDVYSGSKKEADKAKLVLTIVDDAVGKITKGYDIVEYAKDYGYTAETLNSMLSAKPTYFAEAFAQVEYPAAENVTYTISVLSSNDTIYTPVENTDAEDKEANAK